MQPIGEPDSIGTQYYECKKCNIKTTTPRTKAQRDQSMVLRERLKIESNPDYIRAQIQVCKKQKTIEKIGYNTDSLEALYGYTIRKSTNNNDLIFYWIEIDENSQEKLHPIEEVNNTQKWLTDISTAWNIDKDTLKTAKIKAKATIKKKDKNNKEIDDSPFEILTNPINRVSPDSGVIDGKPYLGVWLQVKFEGKDGGEEIKQAFYLLFNDGELILAENQVLATKDIYLTGKPVYTELRTSIDVIVNLALLDKVNPAAIYCEIMKQLTSYIEFTGEKDTRFYTLIALWIMATYYHKQFAAFPYLFINALKGSGKSKLLELISALAYNAIFSPNMSPSSLFRLTQNAGATTLLDETEDLNDPEKKAEFKSLLLAGYKRSGSAYRTEKGPDDTQVPTPYSVFSPKAIANINGLNDVLEDRCIPITMKRGRNFEIVNTEIDPLDDKWLELRDSLTRMYFQECITIADEWKKLEKIEDVFCVGSEGSVGSVVKDRVLESKNLYIARIWQLWRPIIAIAKHIQLFFNNKDKTYTTYTNYTTYTKPLETILSLSLDLINEKITDNDTDTGESMLIKGMLWKVSEDKFYTPNELCIYASSFADFNILPEWFNNTWVGRVLKRMGFKEKRRTGAGVEYRLTPEGVKDIAERLSITLPQGFKAPDSIKGTKEHIERVFKTIHNMALMNDGLVEKEKIIDKEALAALLKEGRLCELGANCEFVGVV
jgi:hypothetical protein